jgi:hypothetical protein
MALICPYTLSGRFDIKDLNKPRKVSNLNINFFNSFISFFPNSVHTLQDTAGDSARSEGTVFARNELIKDLMFLQWLTINDRIY